MNQKVNSLHAIVLACFAIIVYQACALSEVKTRYAFASKTLAEVTFVSQQCESTVEQCCK